MFTAGWLLVLLASLAHAWLSANRNLNESPLLFLGTLAVLCLGLAIFWAATSFWWTFGLLAIYFFVFPLLNMPLLEAFGLVPTRELPRTGPTPALKRLH